MIWVAIPMEVLRMMTFYEWVTTTEHEKPERKALSACFKEQADKHPEIREIDSFHDFITAGHYLTGQAFFAIGDGIWCEYCAATGHLINA